MINFLRSIQIILMECIVSLIIVWGVKWFVVKNLPRGANKAIAKKIATALTLVIIFISIVQVLIFSSINETPRSVIDRSLVNQQIKDFEKRNKQ